MRLSLVLNKLCFKLGRIFKHKLSFRGDSDSTELLDIRDTDAEPSSPNPTLEMLPSNEVTRVYYSLLKYFHEEEKI